MMKFVFTFVSLLILILSACAPIAKSSPTPTSGVTLLPIEMSTPTVILIATPTAMPTVTVTPPTPSLRLLAEKRNFYIGAAMSFDPLGRSDAELYTQILAREFNLLTVEHVMKFAPIHPVPDRYRWQEADEIVAYAERNNMQVRGHTLVWHIELPDWVYKEECSREHMIQVMQGHIQTVVGHYRGKIMAWDVVNEAIDDNGRLRETIWLQCIGPDYIEIAFRSANEADPNALLFYNDYGGEGAGHKSDAIYSLVKNLRGRGVPIHGVGLQMHVTVSDYPNPKLVIKNMQRYAELGLVVHITEMDVAIDIPVTQDKLAKQASVYQQMLEACLSVSNCQAFVLWGFTDRQSWIPAYMKGYDSGLIFDRDYKPKPAYHALLDTLASKP